MVPLPDLPGASGGVLNNFIRPFTIIQNWDQYVGRFDQQVSPKDSLFYRIDVQARSGIDAPLAATAINDTENMHFYNTEAGWTRSWSPRMITQIRLGYHGEYLDLENENITNLPTSTIAGFSGFQPPQNRLPQLSVAPYYNFSEYNFPWRSSQHTFQLISNTTMIVGKHTVKVGFDGRKQILDRKIFGGYVFSLGFTTASFTGNGVGNYLLGLPLTASETLPPTDRWIGFSDYSAFVQDDWKVTSSFTANVGLRYEIQTQ
jgi:outer membrane receptor protein involved in Fe transport